MPLLRGLVGAGRFPAATRVGAAVGAAQGAAHIPEHA